MISAFFFPFLTLEVLLRDPPKKMTLQKQEQTIGILKVAIFYIQGITSLL